MNQGVSEEWRAVVGFENYYQISNHGRVRSFDRVKKNSRGTHVLPGRLMKPGLNGRGYPQVILVGDDGRKVMKKVHRLIAEAFIENPDGYPVVRHLNDVKTDNRIENLAWGSHRDNLLDSVRNGTNVNANKTHCPHGHPYTEENTFFYTKKNGGSGRKCRECKLARDRAYQRNRYRRLRSELTST